MKPRTLATLCLLALPITKTTWAGETHHYAQCDRQPSTSDVQAAKGAFQAGSVSFKEADYDRAILYWEDAYRRDCTATLLLFYLADAYEGKGEFEQAVIALRAYLDRTPDAPDRPQLERRIEVFEEKLAEQRRNARSKPQAVKPQPAPKAPPATPPSSSDREPEGFHVNPVFPLSVAGLGVVGTVIGAIIFFPARSDVQHYEDRCPGRTCVNPGDSTAANDARTSMVIGGSLAIGGLVVAAAGTGWYFHNESTAPPRQRAGLGLPFAAWLSKRGAGVSIGHRF